MEKLEKARIKIKTFNYKLLLESYIKITNELKALNIETSGLIFLPTKKRIYCVLRSPHKYKKSREHFEIKTHSRIFNISFNSKIDLDTILSSIKVPTGVSYNIIKI